MFSCGFKNMLCFFLLFLIFPLFQDLASIWDIEPLLNLIHSKEIRGGGTWHSVEFRLKMRAVVRLIRQSRAVYQHHHYYHSCNLSRRHKPWVYSNLTRRLPRYYDELAVFGLLNSETLRALSVDAAKASTGGLFFQDANDVMFFSCQCKEWIVSLLFSYTFSSADASRAGPLIEYERRIAEGELMDGDMCQVWCAELQ